MIKPNEKKRKETENKGYENKKSEGRDETNIGWREGDGREEYRKR